MSDNCRITSKFHFYLIAISSFLLVLSFAFHSQFNDGSSFTPSSVFDLILANNNTSFYINPNDIEEHNMIKVNLPSDNFSQINSETSITTSLDPTRPVRIDSSEMGKAIMCDSARARLRVYMYDLPPEFHFGLLGWKGKENQTWPEVNNPEKIPRYPGGLNLQHSVEYWLTLDLLSSNVPTISRPCTALLVTNSREADVIFVPFFASLSYNRHSKLHGKEKVSTDKRLQEKLVKFLMSRDEWRAKQGKDHVIVAHHPNSMLNARMKLSSARFLLADFGRYPVEVVNLEKDVIVPYKHLVLNVPTEKSLSFSERSTLAYFKGAIYRKDGGVIRQELFYLLKDEKDVHFSFGSIHSHGINKAGRGMASSKFCLHIAGDTPSSNRLFDAIANHCVPVIISDDIELPYEDVLDYSRFCVFVRSSDAIKTGYVLNFLRGVGEEKWTEMWERLKEIGHLFEYRFPSQPGDAVDMIWQAVSRKISSRRANDRYRRSRSRLWS